MLLILSQESCYENGYQHTYSSLGSRDSDQNKTEAIDHDQWFKNTQYGMYNQNTATDLAEASPKLNNFLQKAEVSANECRENTFAGSSGIELVSRN